MTDILAGTPPAVHAWNAGYYVVSSGAYLAYCESAETGSAEYFSGNVWTDLSADVYSAYSMKHNCWEDADYTVDLATYMPAQYSQYMGTYLLFD